MISAIGAIAPMALFQLSQVIIQLSQVFFQVFDQLTFFTDSADRVVFLHTVNQCASVDEAGFGNPVQGCVAKKHLQDETVSFITTVQKVFDVHHFRECRVRIELPVIKCISRRIGRPIGDNVSTKPDDGLCDIGLFLQKFPKGNRSLTEFFTVKGNFLNPGLVIF